MKRLAYYFLFAPALIAQSRCAIQGIVVDALTGQPLAGAQVFADPDTEDYSALPVRRIAGPQGTFCFENLIPGDYGLRAKRALYLDTNYGEKRPGGNGEDVEITAGQPVTPLTIKMTPQAVISGILSDGDGDPLQSARIDLLKPHWKARQLTTAPVQQTVTDDRGRYRFAGLAAGTYFISAKPGTGPEDPASRKFFLDQNGQPFRQLEGQTYYKSSLSFHDATPIRVIAGQEVSGVSVTLVKAEAHRLSGTVPSEVLNTSPRILFLVEQTDTGPGLVVSVPIQGDRSFVAEGLFPARYLLQGAHVKQEIDLTKGDIEGLAVELSKPELRPAKSIEPVSSAKLASIEGQVTGDHALEGGIMLLLESETDPEFSENRLAGSDGKFQWNSLQPGKYRLYAFEDFDRDSWGNPQLAALLAAKSVALRSQRRRASARNCAAHFSRGVPGSAQKNRFLAYP